MRKQISQQQIPLTIVIMSLMICVATNIASAAIVLLEMKDKNDTTLTIGYGFFVSDTHIAIHADNITNAVKGTAQVLRTDKKYEIQGVASVDTQTGFLQLRVLSSGIAPPIGNISAEYYFKSGAAHAKLRNYEQAIADYTAAIAHKPDFAQAYMYRAEAINNNNEHWGVLSDYDTAIMLKPDSAEAYFHRAKANLIIGRSIDSDDYLMKAIADYDTAIKLKPDYAEAYLYRGETKRAMRRYSKAFLDYDAAIKIKPDYYKAYMIRGNVKRDLEKYEEAFWEYDAADKVKPNQVFAIYNRGHMKFLLREYEAAVKDMDTVIRLNPKYSLPYYDRGRVKHKFGQYEAAIADFNVLIDRLKIKDKWYFYYRGSAKFELGQYKAAVADLDKSLQVNDRFVYSYHERGKAKAKLGQYLEAIRDYDRGISINIPYPDPYFSRVDAKAKLGDNDGALWDNATGSFYRGVQNMYTKRKMEAKKDLETAIKLAEQVKNTEILGRARQSLYELLAGQE